MWCRAARAVARVASRQAPGTCRRQPLAAAAPWRRCCASPASPERRVLYPPGAKATSGFEAGKAEKFERLVVEALHEGCVVELNAKSRAAMLHSLRALSVARTSAEFEVSWVDGGAGSDAVTAKPATKEAAASRASRNAGGEMKALCLVAKKDVPWKDFDFGTSGGHFVSNSTAELPLAKKMALELRKNGSVTVHTYTDAENALVAILRALATVPKLEHTRPLRCSVGAAPTAGERSRRLVVHASPGLGEVGAGTAGGSLEFVAYPPGKNANADYVQRFKDSVQHRLSLDYVVTMQCYGQDAVVHAMAALASMPVRVAGFQARWVQGFSREGSDPNVRALSIHAAQKETWSDFNSNDFMRTNKLNATENSEIKLMSRDIGKEVQHRGGVAVFAHFENVVAVNRAVKALASVPVEHPGLHVVCLPSFGKVGPQDTRAIRFYVRPVG